MPDPFPPHEPLKIFISYSHDTPDHKDRVLALADRLRSDGLDASLDQYESSPLEGWPRWMDRQIEAARYVLLVCTETYQRRVMGREAPDRGLGVIWESNLIYQLIYDAAGRQSKFIPVLLPGGGTKDIPGPLRGATYYDLSQEGGYDLLYRRLTNQPAVGRPPVGRVRQLEQRARQWDDAPPAISGTDTDGAPTEDARSATPPRPPAIAPAGPPLNRRHAQNHEARSYIDLLNPINRAVPLIGREREVSALDTWLDDQRPILARCLVAPPGSGKTRLALELCARAEERGWSTGFIEASELVRFAGAPQRNEPWWTAPTLIVIDQAPSVGRSLRTWLLQLLAVPPAAAPNFRLLVLARHADAALGWWSELIAARDWSEEGILHLFDPPEPCPLASVTDSEQRRSLLAAAIVAAARVKGIAWPIRPPAPGADPVFDRQLGQADGGFEPLQLLMAGINSVDCGKATLLFNHVELMQRLAAHEIGRIEAVADGRGLDRQFLVHMAAFLTLVRGCPRDVLPRLTDGECRAMGWTPGSSLPDIERALCDTLSYEGDAGDIAPILPEVIGEAALVQALGRYPPDVQAAIVRRGYWIYAEDTTGTVIRATQDFAATGGGPVIQWLDALIAEADEPEELLALAAQLPDRTVALIGKAAAIQERAVETLGERYGADPNAGHQTDFAAALVNLSARRRDLGRFDDACAAARQAVELYRRLDPAAATGHRPDLAAALTALAARLSDLGHRHDAFDAAKEAVDLLRDVIAETSQLQPGASGSLPAQSPGLQRAMAQALLEKAAHQSELGLRQEALAIAEEAVELLYALDLEDPHPHRPRLAVSLARLAEHHADLEHRRQALYAAEESVRLLTELVTANADAYRPDLARAQRTLARCLAARGDLDRALAAALAAVDLQRQIAATCPEACNIELAVSLHLLARQLHAPGAPERLAEAAAAETEAVDLLRRLAACSPAAIEPQLARSLNHLATLLMATGDQVSAVAAAKEAVTLEEKLAGERPDRFRPDLARSQQSAAGVLFNAGEYDEAFRLGSEAAAIRRDLVTMLPAAFTPELAENLRLLAEGHMLRDRIKDADAAAREALTIYERLAPALPREQLRAIVDALSALGRTARMRGCRELSGVLQAGIETIRRRAGDAHGAHSRIEPPIRAAGRSSSAADSIVPVRQSAARPGTSPDRPSPEARLANDAVAALTAHLTGGELPVGLDAGCCRTLLGVLQTRLTNDDERESFDDFRASPADADNQAHLRKKLRNAIKADSGVRETLAMLIGTASGVAHR